MTKEALSIIFSIILITGVASSPVKAQFGPIIEGDTIHNDKYYTEILDTTLRVSKHAFGAAFYLRYRNYNGNLDRYFSNIVDIGFSFDYQLKRLFLQVEGLSGFGKTRQTMKFTEDKKWKKNKAAFSSLLNFNAGYVAFEDKSTRFIPLIGVGVDMLHSEFWTISEISDYEPNLPYFNIAVLVDLKSANVITKHTRLNNKDIDYTGLRLSLGMHTPLSNPDYKKYYDGFMFYMTVGFGGVSRKLKRK